MTADDDLSAARDGVALMRLDLRERLPIDERTDVDPVLQTVPDPKSGDERGDAFGEVARGRPLDEQPVRAYARLAGVAEAREHGTRGRRVEIGILEDDEGRVPAELERHALQVIGCSREQ